MKNDKQKNAAKDRMEKTQRRFRDLNIGEDLPSRDLADGDETGGIVRNVKLVDAAYEGQKRKRTLVHLDVDPALDSNGEKGDHNVWLPESHCRPLMAIIGQTIVVARTGKGKSDTRYNVQVAD